MPTRYLEDFKPGEVVELGQRVMTKDAIQVAARQSVFAGLIASGWHTGSVLMRLLYEGVLKDTVSFGSPGLDELRWLRPVRPGDTVRGRLTVLEIAPSRSKPDRGMLKTLVELLNQHGEVVVAVKGMNLIGRRPE